MFQGILNLAVEQILPAIWDLERSFKYWREGREGVKPVVDNPTLERFRQYFKSGASFTMFKLPDVEQYGEYDYQCLFPKGEFSVRNNGAGYDTTADDIITKIFDSFFSSNGFPIEGADLYYANLLRHHGAVYGKTRFQVYIDPVDYGNGLLRTLLYGEPLESATNVSIYCDGVPIAGALIKHDGNIIVTDGATVRRYELQRYDVDGVENRSLKVTLGDELRYHPQAKAKPNLISIVTKPQNNPASASFLASKDSLKRALHVKGAVVQEVAAIGPSRPWTAIVQETSLNGRHGAVSHSGPKLDLADVGPLFAICNALGLAVMLPQSYRILDL
jgi:hypothetical protein